LGGGVRGTGWGTFWLGRGKTLGNPGKKSKTNRGTRNAWALSKVWGGKNGGCELKTLNVLA